VTARVCPDDLLLRDRMGEPPLPLAERRALDGHLATCAPCRMSRALLDAVGPLPPVGAADEALAGRMLASWSLGQGEGRASGRGSAPGGRVRWAAAAAAILLITAGASAAWYRALPRRPTVAPPASPPQQPSVRPRLAPRASEPPLESPPPVVVPPEAQIAATRPQPRRAPPVSVPSAPALFEHANQARARGDRSAATSLYRELEARFPTTPEARVSFFSLGEMLLGEGDARGALGQFREYLRAGDATLSEEALVRAARACQQLGRTDEEISLWRRLLADSPRSDYRWRAEDRLRALGDGAP
jgi:TolA-binding protein